MRILPSTQPLQLVILGLLCLSPGQFAIADSVVQIGSGTYDVDWVNRTSFHDRRAQLLYHGSEIGQTGQIGTVGFYCTDTPGLTLLNWTIRMQTTTKTHFEGDSEWIATGWTECYQDLSYTSEWPEDQWVTFHLTTPFTYDSTAENLIVDVSFNNSSYSLHGKVAATFVGSGDTEDNRVFYYNDDSHFGDDPLEWGSEPTPLGYTDNRLPNVQLGFSDDVVVPAPASVVLVPLALGAVAFFKRRREAA